MSLDIETFMRVMDACSLQASDRRLVSFVFPHKSGATQGQIFLDWVEGKTIKEYLKEPALNRVFPIYRACHSRIVDHRGIKRRLRATLKSGDEIRFIPGQQ